MKRWIMLTLVLGLGLSGCKMLGLSSENTVEPRAQVAAEAGTPSRLAWQMDIGTSSRLAKLTPVVVDDQIYAASESGRLVAVSLDGKVIWDVNVGFKVFGGVGADDQLVVVGGSKGELAAFNAQTGEEVWRSAAASEVVVPPVVTPSVIVIRTLDGRIFGLNREDGKRKWVYQRILPALILRSAAPMTWAQDYIFIGYPGGKLIALQQDRGALALEESVSTPRGDNELERLTDISSQPIIVGTEVCVGAYQGRVGCFNLRTGEAMWFKEISTAAGLDMDDRAVYVAGDDGYLYGLDKDLGTERWKADVLPKGRLVRPVVADDTVIVGDMHGLLHFQATSDGRNLGRISIDKTPLTAAPVLLPTGGILVQTTGGKLSALVPSS